MTEPVRATPWTETFRVRAYETDPHGLVAVQTLCNYFQESAANHAGALDVSVERLTPLGWMWVLSRLFIEVDRYPAWRSDVQVETWPSGEDGLYARREFLLRDGRGAFGRGTSAWLLVDVARRRPVRIPGFIQEIALPERTRPVELPSDRLKTPSEVDFTQRFRVRYSDLDVNRHVNNSRYVEWAVESVPPDVLHDAEIASLDLYFRAETSFSDTVVVHTQRDSDHLHFTHGLLSEQHERPVALARTRWRSR